MSDSIPSNRSSIIFKEILNSFISFHIFSIIESSKFFLLKSFLNCSNLFLLIFISPKGTVIDFLPGKLSESLKLLSKVGISYNKFYISGGLSDMSGLLNFLNENLNVEFSYLNPFNKMDLNQEIDNKSKYAISFGLALRELDKS